MNDNTTAMRLAEVDPSTLVIDPNVRLNPTLDKPFLESVRELGVLSPITAVEREGELHVRYGQRRTLAAVQTHRPTIPVYVVADTDAARVVIEQLAENDHRAPITESDRGHAVETLAGLGLTAAQIAKRTKMSRATVDAATAVQGSEAARSAVAAYSITLEQAAILAQFEDDPETLATLTETAENSPGQFDHQAQRAVDRRDSIAAAAAEVERLTHAGYTLRENAPAWDEKVDRLSDLRPKDADTGTQPDPADYLATGDLTVLVRAGWRGEADVTFYIAGARRHGLVPRYNGAGGGVATGPMTDEQKAERREKIANNKAWKSAEVVRRRWLTTFAARKTSPKDAPAYLAGTLAGGLYSLHRAATGHHALARELMGLAEHTWGSDDALAEAIAKATPARAAHLALVIALAAVESGTGPHTWQSSHDAGYFQALARWGYTLSEVETLAAQPRPRLVLDNTPAPDDDASEDDYPEDDEQAE